LSAYGPGKDLDFTVVRPGGLTLEPPNGIVKVIEGQVIAKPLPQQRVKSAMRDNRPAGSSVLSFDLP
jgi:hypothetical protein